MMIAGHPRPGHQANRGANFLKVLSRWVRIRDGRMLSQIATALLLSSRLTRVSTSSLDVDNSDVGTARQSQKFACLVPEL
jgi:hypothetical protein